MSRIKRSIVASLLAATAIVGVTAAPHISGAPVADRLCC
jgi:hypothetical protein